MHLPQRPTILQKNDTGEPQDTEVKTAIINIIQQFRQLTEDTKKHLNKFQRDRNDLLIAAKKKENLHYKYIYN